MWKLKIFGILLLGSCGVVFAYAEQIVPEETTIESNVDEVTLSTELKPPPLPAAGEHRGIVYLINLFAVKNKTGETSEEKSENALQPESSEVVGPLASLLLVIDEDEEGPLDGLTKLLVDSDYEAEDTDSEEDSEKDVKVDPTFAKALKAEADKLKNGKKIRSKRTIFRKNRVCESSGGYGGNYGDSHHSNRGGNEPGYEVYIIPVSGGGGGGGSHHGGDNQGGHYGGGGGQFRPHQIEPQYPGGGGNQWGNGGGGGGSGASAHATAYADAVAYGG